MEELGDGNLLFRKGEPLPFVCPACLMAIPFDQNAFTLQCECGHRGDVADFSRYDWAFSNGEWTPVLREAVQ